EFVSDGRCVFTGIARDIAERKRAENMLSQLAFIVESSNDAIIGMTLRGNIVSWNKGAEKLYGYAPNEVLGKSVSLLLPPEQADEQMTLLGKVAQGENVKPFETVRRRKNGDLIDVSLSVSPITNATGRICGASAIARDISEHKRDEAELERQKAAAEAASRAKDQFLAVLSHELRTPLTPVLAGVEALDDEPQSPEARHILAAMRRNIELEARLIDDLLDLTRVNRGKLQLNPGLIDVHAAISHVADICKHDSDCKKLEVNLRLNAGQHCVEADSARLHQIFWNLLQNAVKFTDKGGLITIVTSNPTPGEIVVTFQDSGIGIDPSAMSRIFDPFEQGERSIQRRFGGLGLGLAITNALVNAHGGQLSASSKGKGKGATFTVLLKTSARKPNEKKITPDTAPASSVLGCKILLVEDHDDTREAINRLLTRRGYSVTVAATMREGLVAGTREEFDFLISDIGLPDGSGHVLMNELRRISGVKGIALSGFGMDSDLERSKQSGFSEHLTKPLNLEKLEEVMRKLSVCEPAEHAS
ncbi:MAG: PAS domain S-box protein, partial [Verrucomicrobiota bacterium]|nr:PAS domain S-box protein [Verrucomicrobiota bacterium]